MTDIARRTIDELLVRYDLEPKLNDIYVEGIFDKDILLNHFYTNELNDISVYDIGCVDVSAELLVSHGFTEGNKQRVIVLARELAKNLENCSYRCLVDKDLDHWFDELETTERLTWTEFCSLELNFWLDEILRNIVITTAKAKIATWDDYTDTMISVLRDLYSLRLADRALGWSLEWIQIERCMSIENSKIIFDNDGYINRLLSKNKKLKEKELFVQTANNLKTKLKGDHRNYVRGHDFVELLAWSIGKFKGIKEFSTAVSIERLFVLLSPNLSSLGNILSE